MTTSSENGFVDIAPVGRGRGSASAVPKDGISLAINVKTGKGDAAKYGMRHSSLGMVVRGATLETLRWRAGDRIRFQVNPAKPSVLRMRRASDGIGSKLCDNTKGRTSCGLKTSLTTAAFGVKAAAAVGLIPCRIVLIEKDAVVIEVPAEIRPAIFGTVAG